MGIIDLGILLNQIAPNFAPIFLKTTEVFMPSYNSIHFLIVAHT